MVSVKLDTTEPPRDLPPRPEVASNSKPIPPKGAPTGGTKASKYNAPMEVLPVFSEMAGTPVMYTNVQPTAPQRMNGSPLGHETTMSFDKALPKLYNSRSTGEPLIPGAYILRGDTTGCNAGIKSGILFPHPTSVLGQATGLARKDWYQSGKPKVQLRNIKSFGSENIGKWRSPDTMLLSASLLFGYVIGTCNKNIEKQGGGQVGTSIFMKLALAPVAILMLAQLLYRVGATRSSTERLALFDSAPSTGKNSGTLPTNSDYTSETPGPYYNGSFSAGKHSLGNPDSTPVLVPEENGTGECAHKSRSIIQEERESGICHCATAPRSRIQTTPAAYVRDDSFERGSATKDNFVAHSSPSSRPSGSRNTNVNSVCPIDTTKRDGKLPLYCQQYPYMLRHKPQFQTTLQMLQCLVEHGCVDLTSFVDLNATSPGSVTGGSFGDIWRGKLYNETQVAIKLWRFIPSENKPKLLKRTMREIYSWVKLDHENIHKLLGVTLFQGRLGMVSEWMDNGNLREYIHKIPGTDRYKLCAQVTKGLQHIHAQNMVHGDLKAANILVSRDGVAKLTDFGHAIAFECSLRFSETSQIGGGTLRWMAPELVICTPSPQRNKRTDIYALGMTLFEIIVGEVPYESECPNAYQIVMKLSAKVFPKRAKPFDIDERGGRIWVLLEQCWDHDPDARPTADTVLERVENIIGTDPASGPPNAPQTASTQAETYSLNRDDASPRSTEQANTSGI